MSGVEGMPKGLQASEDAAQAVAKTPNRVSTDSIWAKVSEVEFHKPALCPHMTVAFVQLANGYVVTGESAPADPANFDLVLGRELALEAALRKVWPLEGYLLREKLVVDEV